MMNKAYLWLGRFVGTAVFLYSAYLLVVWIAEIISGGRYEFLWIAIWILGSAFVGTAASLLFLLTIDGPVRWRTAGMRMASWWLMFLSILLPTSISFFLAPLTATTIGLSFQRPLPPPGRHIKSR